MDGTRVCGRGLRSAQLEPCLTHKKALHTLTTP